MRRLEWDSNFWDTDIYNLEDITSFEYDFISNIPASMKSWLIQILVSENEVEKINYLEDKGFRFVESKVSLNKSVTEIIEIEENKYKKILNEDINSKYNTFYEMYGEYTRFSNFSNDKINEFYYTWIINSISGKMDDKCIGYYADNQLAGFVTYSYLDTGVSIGLFGVFSQFRKRGIGQKLLDYVNNDSLNNRYSQIFVSTQGKNVGAINTYVKNGFIFENIKNWYYLKGEKL